MADDKNIYGIKYEVDIESLKTSTAEAGRQIKLANAEFNKSQSELDNWATSVDGVSAKIQQLNTILQAEKSKLAQSQSEYNKTIDSISKYSKEIEEAKSKKQKLIQQYGEESKEVKQASVEINKLEREQSALKKTADNLKVSINNQTATVNKTEKSLKGYESQLEDVKKAQSQAEKSGRTLEEELKDIQNASDEVADSTGKLGDGFTVLKGTIASLIANGISNLIGGIKSAVEETREFRTELGKLEATAQTTGTSFDKVKSNLREVNSITGDTGAGVEGLNNIMSAGFDGKALDEITDQLLGASIKWKDTLKFEGLSDGLQETLATGSAVGPFAELIERAGGSLEDFDSGLQQAIKDGNEQNYVLEYLSQYGLNDVKKAYEENNQTLIDSANASYDYQQTMAQLSEKVEPILTSIKKGFTDLLNSIISTTDGLDTQAIADKISQGFTYFTENIAPKVVEAFKFIVDNGNLIIPILSGIGAGFMAFKIGGIITTLVGGFNTLFTTIKAGDGIMKALNLTMKANPFVLIATLIAGLVVAFITLWNTSEEFRNFWIGLWEGIKNTVSTAIDTVTNIFNSIIDFIKNNWQSLLLLLVNPFAGAFKLIYDHNDKFKKAVDDLVKKIIGFFTNLGKDLMNFATVTVPKIINTIVNFFATLPTKIWNFLVQTFNKVTTFGSNMISKATEIGSNFISNVINFVSQLPSKMWSWFTKAISQVVNLGSNLASKGLEAGKKLFDSIVNKVKDIPSEMLNIGKNIVEGLWNGINDMAGWISDKIGGFTDGVLNGIKDFFGIASPSKETAWMGEMLGKGLGNGIAKMSDYAVKKASIMSNDIMDQLRGNLDTITVDFDSVNKMKNGVYSSSNRLGNNGSNTVNNVTFNQYNTSPKALDSLEVYKNTRKQIQQYKLWGGATS